MGRTNLENTVQHASPELWVDVRTIAQITGYTVQHVRRLAKGDGDGDQRWAHRTVRKRGGPRMEFRVADLPLDLACHFVQPVTRIETESSVLSLAVEQKLVLSAPYYNRRKWEKYKQLFLKFGELHGAQLDQALNAWNALSFLEAMLGVSISKPNLD